MHAMRKIARKFCENLRSFRKNIYFFSFRASIRPQETSTIALGLLLASSKATSALSAEATTLGFLLMQQRHLIFLPEATTTFDFSAKATTTFDFSAEVTTTFDFSDRSNNDI